MRFGLTYVGGFLKDRIRLHSVATGKRLTPQAKPSDCRFLTFSTLSNQQEESRFLCQMKQAVSARYFL
jgi:hypothetical protein